VDEHMHLAPAKFGLARTMLAEARTLDEVINLLARLIGTWRRGTFNTLGSIAEEVDCATIIGFSVRCGTQCHA